MTFDWQCYLTLAETLKDDDIFKDGLSDAAKRTAISRAYYAAFHFARIFVMNSQNPPELRGDASEHTVVPKWLREHRRYRAGNLLGNLRYSRIEADYKNEANISDELVRDAINNSKEIFFLLKSS